MNTRERGAALMLVVWLVALMTALVGSFALSARVESMLGHGLGRRVAAEGAARAGIEYAIYQLGHADPAQRWQADGRAYAWRFAGTELTLRAVDAAGLVDLNTSDTPLLAALFRHFGVSAQRADALAAAIVEWRGTDGRSWVLDEARQRVAGLSDDLRRHAPFASVAELQDVPGMEAALYARVRPHVTLYSGRVLPDPRLAPPEVISVLGMDVPAALSLREGGQLLSTPASGSGVVSIEASARLANGREHRVSALVRPRMGGHGRAYTVLEWHGGDEWQ